jgi:hypothetical protein
MCILLVANYASLAAYSISLAHFCCKVGCVSLSVSNS